MNVSTRKYVRYILLNKINIILKLGTFANYKIAIRCKISQAYSLQI